MILPANLSVVGAGWHWPCSAASRFAGVGHTMFGFETVLAAMVTGSLLSLAVSQLFQLVSQMVDLEAGEVPRLAVLGLMLLAGPHILAAAARKLARMQEYPWEYAAVVYLASAVWAGVIGFAALTAISGLWIFVS